MPLVFPPCNKHFIHIFPNKKDGAHLKLGKIRRAEKRAQHIQSSFSSRFPRDVMDSAHMNSLKVISPSLSSSKTLNTYSAKELGSPRGKNCRNEHVLASGIA